jgi:hypothetical protein
MPFKGTGNDAIGVLFDEVELIPAREYVVAAIRFNRTSTAL